ncbi:glycosyltransferase [Pleurocapsa sp. FMAR1]|uniref:glycosyltransferase n=1 Tax=Pleurocapsa sp. FMAR1 TaxID=3040204 RepID=UPI0029C67F9B|nr:glycosyltransferase [Pleurocapsa sp. FMAR1]
MLQIAAVNLLQPIAGQTDYDADLQPLISRSPLISCEVCVIVPVRDEADNIEATLLALTNQVDLTGKPLDKNRYEIIVLANNCTDNSAEVARRFARTYPSLILHIVEMTIESDRAHIGWVRKLLMDEAYRRLKSIERDFGVIASTDGDTRVSSTWIAATLAEIKAGADAVGGRIITNSRERSKLDKTTRLYFLRYLRYGYLTSQLEAFLDPYFDPLPRHHHHYGASFAITARMYAKVGGLPPLPSSEDLALYNALMRVDACFRHSPTVRVVTSARDLGRAKAGLADRLSQLKTIGQQQQCLWVESALTTEARFRLRRQLRYLWHTTLTGKTSAVKMAIVAQKLGINKDLLTEIIWRSQAMSIGLSPSFGLVVEQIGQYQEQNADLYSKYAQKVTIQQAIVDLQALINQTYIDRHHLRKQTNYYSSLNSLEQIEPISLLPQSV